MIVGDLEPEETAEPTPSIKPKLESGTIREDVDDIVNGMSSLKNYVAAILLISCRSIAWCPPSFFKTRPIA